MEVLEDLSAIFKDFDIAPGISVPSCSISMIYEDPELIAEKTKGKFLRITLQSMTKDTLRFYF